MTLLKADRLFAENRADLICEDLYQAACFNSDGSPRFEGRRRQIVTELNKPIDAARDKAARAIGFKSYEEALKTQLKKADIELVTGGDEKHPTFIAVENCNKEFAEAKSPAEVEKVYQKNLDLTIPFVARNIPQFIHNHVMAKCAQLKNAPSVYLPELNPEAAKICSQPLALQQKGIQLFRLEGTPGYKKEAESFVRAYWLPELKQKSANAAGASSNALCTTLQSALQNSADRVKEDFVSEVNKSRIVIEALIEHTYSEKKKAITHQLFQQTKADLKDMVEQTVKDPAKKARIIDEYDRMELFWMKKPDPSIYKKNELGLEVLDENKNPTRVVSESENDAYWVFLDEPTLTHFTSFDANYYPNMTVGKHKISEKIQIRPGALQTLEANPEAYTLILAHEAGHKAAPKMSLANGHDLNPEFQKVLQCLQQSQSIRLQRNQTDEALADNISAEVLGRRLSQRPFAERRKALLESVESLCPQGENIAHTVSIYCKGTHPDDSLRASGIFGAHPLIRKAIGCSAESSKFKTCGLSAAPQGLPENSTKDIKTSPEGLKSESEKGLQ